MDIIYRPSKTIGLVLLYIFATFFSSNAAHSIELNLSSLTLSKHIDKATSREILSNINQLDGYNSRDYVDLFEQVSAHARSGNDEAIGLLGVLYFYGIGTTQDVDKAVELLSNAHANKDLGGVISGLLAIAYYKGISVEQDYDAAFDLFYSSIDYSVNNYIFKGAYKYLAEMYFKGYGVSTDYSKAYLFIVKSLSNNPKEAKSKNMLASLYEQGLGLKSNYKLAHELYNQVITDNNEPQEVARAYYSLSRFYKEGLEVTVDHDTARKYVKKAAELGNILALHEMYESYKYGIGVEKNESLSLNYLFKLADIDDPKAINMLGEYYASNDNLIEAYKWYRRGALLNDSQSQYQLGMQYFEGNGSKQDYEKAMHWLQKSAEQGYHESYYILGKMHYEGLGCRKSKGIGLRYLDQAVKSNDENAIAYLNDIKAKLKQNKN